MSTIREMTINDYEQMIELWNGIEGLALSNADSKENIDMYLKRNKGLSYVCEQDSKIVGNGFWASTGREKRSGFFVYSKNT